MLNEPALSLHIPEPGARPGDRPNFARMKLPGAGNLARPPVEADEKELRHYPYSLIRVLDDKGTAIGEWDPKLDGKPLLDGLTAMMLARTFDERLFRAHRQGKTSFYMKSTGEEAISVAQSLALRSGDMCFPTYRMLGWLMARRYPLEKLVNQIFSNAADPLAGKQLPILYSAKDYGFFSLSGNLSTQLGHAVGWAMASAYKRGDSIALGVVGEGSSAEGDFHEALTFASVYRVPVILCVTNNQWAISTFSGIAGDGLTTFAAKALAYGIPGLRVDGNDFLAVWAATRWAEQRARLNMGATLIEMFTYRVDGHSTSDDPTKYRPSDEPSAWPLGDPIARLKQHMIAKEIWDEERHAELQEKLDVNVRTAVKSAEAIGTLGQSKPPLANMFEGVFKDRDWRLDEQRRELGI